MNGAPSSGFNQLKDKKSLDDILAVATEFERTARDFYGALVNKVSKPLRYLVEELATEEQRHYDLFAELRARADLAEQIQAMVETPESDGRFSDAVHLPELGEKPDDQAVLQYALYREHTAMEQYQALAASTEPGPIQELFIWLADEETRHKQELEKRYYEIVHSGGV
ncbi:ferritin family protein [Magnetofaba australis]|uniref:Putative rubrerythrin n=1 Tax=Magnetofaba australis IT-1 TaxID=1434232 RepID=A0A1Y2K3Y7_9PROT|nr:ferritin family protein [Magnetofaba australis]OSM04078.1 putative rubrerythrin [Magnetofaba australis IT-1]